MRHLAYCMTAKKTLRNKTKKQLEMQGCIAKRGERVKRLCSFRSNPPLTESISAASSGSYCRTTYKEERNHAQSREHPKWSERNEVVWWGQTPFLGPVFPKDDRKSHWCNAWNPNCSNQLRPGNVPSNLQILPHIWYGSPTRVVAKQFSNLFHNPKKGLIASSVKSGDLKARTEIIPLKNEQLTVTETCLI